MHVNQVENYCWINMAIRDIIHNQALRKQKVSCQDSTSGVYCASRGKSEREKGRRNGNGIRITIFASFVLILRSRSSISLLSCRLWWWNSTTRRSWDWRPGRPWRPHSTHCPRRHRRVIHVPGRRSCLWSYIGSVSVKVARVIIGHILDYVLCFRIATKGKIVSHTWGLA